MRTVLVVLLLLFSTLFHSPHLGGSVVFPSLKSQLLLQFYTRMLLDVISLVPLWMPPPPVGMMHALTPTGKWGVESHTAEVRCEGRQEWRSAEPNTCILRRFQPLYCCHIA